MNTENGDGVQIPYAPPLGSGFTPGGAVLTDFLQDGWSAVGPDH